MASANTPKMQIGDNAPTPSRPPSPEKHATTILGIPEATPGPNAFAEQAIRKHRNRLETNAWYQKAVKEAHANPPTDIHPALRPGFNSGPPETLIFGNENMRGSAVTTMSPFINAGKESSPELNLVPGTGQFAEPTKRGAIEDQREQMVHEASGSDEGRIPVYETFTPTPKPASTEFAKPNTPRKVRYSLPKKDEVVAEAPRTPKKSFFERLGLAKLGGTSTTAEALPEEGNVPPKAQAVLGASAMTSLGRSPSKLKKGLFSSVSSRKTTDLDTANDVLVRQSASTEAEEPLRTASTVAKTPQTAIPEPMHYSSPTGKRVHSQTLSDRGAVHGQDATKCTMQRSQSLKYLDSVPPPTPPAKNTPPHEKAKQDAAAGRSNRVPFHQIESTPAKDLMISTSDRISPTKFGNYGHKETPRLVTKPSMYSLHASVVPAMSEATEFEKIKSRIDGLGLEGFNMPQENYHHRSSEMVYSPSIYSEDWGARGSIIPRTTRHGHRKTMDDLSTLLEAPNEGRSASLHTKASSASAFTVPIFYPELASDPSYNNLTQHFNAQPGSHAASEAGHLTQLARDDEVLPTHGQTRSREHSNSPRLSSLPSFEAGGQPAADTDPTIEGDLFARPVDELGREIPQPSPSSFDHPSAMPSPLHFLPSTVYTPPPSKKLRGRGNDARGQPQDDRELAMRRGDGLGIRSREQSRTGSPSRGNILDTAPVLSAQLGQRTTASPQHSVSRLTDSSRPDVDPKKPGTVSHGADKQDQMLDLLSKIEMRSERRTEDLTMMRNEIRTANARLDERLAVVETMQRSSPSPSYGLDGAARQHEHAERSNQHRVTTEVAHNFYRQQPVAQASRSVASAAGQETMEGLQQTNRQLADIVRGLAAKVEEMEKKMGGNA